jgi:hypothetical protein
VGVSLGGCLVWCSLRSRELRSRGTWMCKNLSACLADGGLATLAQASSQVLGVCAGVVRRFGNLMEFSLKTLLLRRSRKCFAFRVAEFRSPI